MDASMGKVTVICTNDVHQSQSLLKREIPKINEGIHVFKMINAVVQNMIFVLCIYCSESRTENLNVAVYYNYHATYHDLMFYLFTYSEN